MKKGMRTLEALVTYGSLIKFDLQESMKVIRFRLVVNKILLVIIKRRVKEL